MLKLGSINIITCGKQAGTCAKQRYGSLNARFNAVIDLLDGALKTALILLLGQLGEVMSNNQCEAKSEE